MPDTAAADTSRATVLPPIEVVGSIAPAAGPTSAPACPARVTTLDAAQVDAYEPRILSDASRQVAGFSTYDDLGSPYKLNLSSVASTRRRSSACRRASRCSSTASG